MSRIHSVCLITVLMALSVRPAFPASPNPVGTQPEGTLSGKVIFVHAGHGWTAENLGDGEWTTQRPETFEMVEDLGNQDATTILVDHLWNAGATVVPLRPVGYQPHEVVIDNQHPEVELSGTWSAGGANVFYGPASGTPYLVASSSVTETAYARYRPFFPETDFYPVYCWAGHGSDRIRQLYRVTHTGGTTEVSVDHRMVGNGLVYLGTFHFEQGNSGFVDISNRNSEAGLVVADMIRFGNGMGDIDRGGGFSGETREDEAGLYWVQWHVDRSQGIPDSEYRESTNDRNATVSLAPRWAEFMNREAAGTLADRVFISYHSQDGGGSARGVLGFFNGNNTPSSATPNQFLLADSVAREINDDMVAQNGQFEHHWADRTTVTLDRSDIEFGEINNNYIDDEFDATIIEVAFHDNPLDAELLRDAKVRTAVARATHQGLVRYFNVVDGGATPLTFLPGPVQRLQATNNGDGTVELSWASPFADGIVWDPPTSFRVYTSLDGKGFDGGTVVAGGATASHTMTGLDPANGAHYFKVASVNAAGESHDPLVVAATPLNAPSSVLIVNGFNRLERQLNPRLPYLAGTIDRVRPRFSNSRDYVVQVAEAIEAFGSGEGMDSAENSNVISGDILLGDYEFVVWILGEESSTDQTFDTTEQALVTAFLTGGGNLFVSGSEIGWDLDNLDNGRPFYNGLLRANYVSDDANTYEVAGAPGSIFEGLSFSFDDGSYYYNTEYPDVIAPMNGSATAMTYVGGAGGGAAIQYQGSIGEGDVVMLAFPFETILEEQNRAVVMAAILQFVGFSQPIFTDGFESGNTSMWSSSIGD